MLTAILTVMMFYIIDALSRNKSVGDGNLRLCLSWATVVIVVFAVIFLFYTNSFLIKRGKGNRRLQYIGNGQAAYCQDADH